MKQTNERIVEVLSWYEQQAERTLAPLPPDQHRLHILAGIFTEMAEFVDLFKKSLAYGKSYSVQQVEEEWADAMWYAVNLYPSEDYGQRLNYEHILYHLADTAMEVSNTSIIRWVTDDMVEAYRRIVFGEGTSRFIAEWINLANFAGIDWEGALHRNIAKLKVRFPDKFNSGLAIDRNTDREKEVL